MKVLNAGDGVHKEPPVTGRWVERIPRELPLTRDTRRTPWPIRVRVSLPDGPLELIDAKTLFADAPLGRRSAASLARVESTGRLLLTYLARRRR